MPLNNVQSPCVRNCCLNEQDICLGCFRSLKEITQWSSASNQSKLAIIEKTQHRRQQQKR
ncbi:DUF1289 domain-containing protein [Colwellia sp. RSH04]|uniref:DUF1289 domain-containing protein n=1 Tax=Colwellia sp. RSH04 TaxID=2305464 RepID=UPI000E580C48|nr:DUF1289 domain-containing protein [Colwellia sp. RSH04]RHW76657.1 DUF1289 domain-containing protein [Colwellia sp. RSH04]